MQRFAPARAFKLAAFLSVFLFVPVRLVEAQTPTEAQTQTNCAPPCDPNCAPPCVPPAAPAPAQAPAQPLPERRLEIYGYVMTDFGFNFDRIDPDWFDVMRPTKLPAFHRQFGRNGETFAGVRQTRTGIKGFEPTPLGELQTTFEWELFGVGVNAGETTFRLRHAYGEIGHFGAGQTWSPFMDIDIFPNSIEYWGPNGMAFFRNVQVRWMPLKGDTRLTFAVERPGSSQDLGRLRNIQDRIEILGIIPRFPYPDISGEFRVGGNWGYVEAAGIMGQTRLDDTNELDEFNLDQTIDRWGANFTSTINFGRKDQLKMGYVFGQGMENYMNDAPTDIGPVANFGDPIRPFRGRALPFNGLTAFYDHYWSDHWSSTAGYSQLAIKNTNLQLPSEFHRGQYALADLLCYPVDNMMVGGEIQWGRRTNFADGFHANDWKLQFSFRFNFKAVIAGQP